MKIIMKSDAIYHDPHNGMKSFFAGQEYDVEPIVAATLRRMHKVQWTSEQIEKLVHEDAPEWYRNTVETLWGAR